MTKKKPYHHRWVLALLMSAALMSIGVSAKNLLYTPDGRVLHLKGGVTQPDLSQYRSPLEPGQICSSAQSQAATAEFFDIRR